MSTLETLKWLVGTNFFNFLILVILFVWICRKFKLGEKLNEAKAKIEKTLLDSDNEKLQSVYTLKEAEDEVKNLPEELAKINDNATKSIEAYEKTAQVEFEAAQVQLEANADRMISNEVQKISLMLQKETAQKAVSNAYKKAGEFLNNDELQRKFIKEAIQKIEEINI